MHEVLATSVAPAKLIWLVPAAAVIVPPPQEPPSPFGVLIVNPAGNVSVNPTPLRLEAVLLFCTVKVNDVDPFSGMLAAPNTLLSATGAITVSIAVEVFPVPAVVELAVTLLLATPAAIPVTFTVNVQFPLTASVAPDRLTELLPATPVIVPPPHVPVSPFGVLTTSDAGSVSVNATPASGIVFAAGFVKVNDNVVLLFRAMVESPNDLAIIWVVTTFSVKFCVALAPNPLLAVIVNE